MANEITPVGSLSYLDSENTSEQLVIPTTFLASVTTKKVMRLKQAIPTTEVALNLGGIAAPGYVLIINRDPTNYVSLRRATGETEAAHLDANGGFALLKLGSGAQVPFLIANTAACQVEFLLIST
jgi:hypothetical protein